MAEFWGIVIIALFASFAVGPVMAGIIFVVGVIGEVVAGIVDSIQNHDK